MTPDTVTHTDAAPEPVRQPWTPPALREMNVERATRSGFYTAPFEDSTYSPLVSGRG